MANLPLAAPTASGGLIPDAKPTKIPGTDGTIGTLFSYGLWVLLLVGACAVGFGIYKLATVDKGHRGGGGGSEPFKWMGGGVAAMLLSSSLIAILNGIVGG